MPKNQDLDPHSEIREAVRGLCAKFGDDYWRGRDEAHEFPWDFYAAMADAGWIGVAIPETYGGGGGGITEASIVLEEVAASGAAMNGCSAVHLSIFGMTPVITHGSEEMKRRYLPRVASGDLHIAFGVTEPDAGTDTSAITTKAVRVGDHYVVSGRKVWTTKAIESEKVLLLARTSAASPTSAPTDGMTLLLADLQKPTTSTFVPSLRPAAMPSPPAKFVTTACRCSSPTTLVKKARDFVTFSTL